MTHTIPSLLALTLLSLTPQAAALSASQNSSPGSALRFDGDDDLATVLNGQGDFNLTSSFTVEAWIQVDQANPGGAFVGAQTPFGGGAWALTGGFGSPTAAAFTVSVPSSDAVSSSGAIVPGPDWTHFAGTYDGTTMSLFINGVLAAQKVHPTGGSSSSVGQLIMGRFPAGTSNFFEGSLDEVRVWNTVRTATEILASYNVQVSGSSPGLVAYYKFDEASGDDVLDSSSRGNHGVLGAAAGPGSDDPARVVSGVPLATGDLGATYCSPAVINSSGSPGALRAAGSATVADNDVTLMASDLPVNSFGFFVTSTTQGLVVGPAGSQGNLCLAGNIGRFVGAGQIQNSGMSGEFSLLLDLNQQPTPTGLIAVGAGETWNFQTWYRDSVGGSSTSNFTDAVSINFE